MKKSLLIFLGFIALFPLSYWIFSNTSPGIPPFEVGNISPTQMEGEKSLPFFELMSPLPNLETNTIIPQLDYLQGPPDRFLEKLVLVISPERSRAKERIVYFGRRTNQQEENPAQTLKAAIDFIKTNEVPTYLNVSGFLSTFFMKWKLSKLAQRELFNVEKAYIMDQSGAPAFLFLLKDTPRKTARILFFRKNSQYEIQLIADKDFQSILPQDFFAKSFLSQKLSDAQEYTGRELSKIKMDQSNSANLSTSDIQWPMALLAANLSVSPKSIESFFHFAGISALLYKSTSLPANDTEISDILRNNVLACGLYAKDVAPDSTKAAEIANLGRALIKSFEPDSR